MTILSIALASACGGDDTQSSGGFTDNLGGAAGSPAAGGQAGASGGAGKGGSGLAGGAGGSSGTGGAGAGGGAGQGAGGAVHVAAGEYHTCVLLADGGLKCWGDNSFGQLGSGPIVDLSHKDAPTAVTGLTGVTGLSAGWSTTCAVHADGTGQCWGSNENGELGSGATGSSTFQPVAVTLTGLVQLSPGFEFGVGLTKDGTVSAWGKLPGAVSTTPKPKPFDGVSKMVAISSHYFSGCALESSGKVKCWGSNGFGALGVTDFTSDIEYVENISNAVDLAVGTDFACVAQKDTTISCWGRNNGKQLGDPTNTADTSLAKQVPGITGATRVACGGFHGCAIVGGGKVKCWGDSSANQSGNPTASTTDPVPPTEVQGVSDAVEITACYGHTCARTAAGKLFCWGLNDSGQLGDGTALKRTTPIEVDL